MIFIMPPGFENSPPKRPLKKSIQMSMRAFRSRFRSRKSGIENRMHPQREIVGEEHRPADREAARRSGLGLMPCAVTTRIRRPKRSAAAEAEQGEHPCLRCWLVGACSDHDLI